MAIKDLYRYSSCCPSLIRRGGSCRGRAANQSNCSSAGPVVSPLDDKAERLDRAGIVVLVEARSDSSGVRACSGQLWPLLLPVAPVSKMKGNGMSGFFCWLSWLVTARPYITILVLIIITVLLAAGVTMRAAALETKSTLPGESAVAQALDESDELFGDSG